MSNMLISMPLPLPLPMPMPDRAGPVVLPSTYSTLLYSTLLCSALLCPTPLCSLSSQDRIGQGRAATGQHKAEAEAEEHHDVVHRASCAVRLASYIHTYIHTVFTVVLKYVYTRCDASV